MEERCFGDSFCSCTCKSVCCKPVQWSCGSWHTSTSIHWSLSFPKEVLFGKVHLLKDQEVPYHWDNLIYPISELQVLLLLANRGFQEPRGRAPQITLMVQGEAWTCFNTGTCVACRRQGVLTAFQHNLLQRGSKEWSRNCSALQ